jgi:hypothetical protein
VEVMKQLFFEQLKKNYPELPNSSFSLISDNLISPFKVQLPKKILEQAKLVTEKLYSLRENPSYQKKILSGYNQHIQFDPKNKAICMSYDYHLDQDDNLKLIEINTNAAFLLLGIHLYEAQGLPSPIADFTNSEIIENILEEYRLAEKTDLSSITITDKNPEQQRLYIEFLAFHYLFKKNGFHSQILDIQNLNVPTDFIYNRHTDFYFESPQTEFLKNFYLEKRSVVSPNPHEYALLADKRRLMDWTNQVDEFHLKVIEPYLLKSFKMDNEIKPEIWTKRKNLFFKPMQSFGAKMSYRGESISRKLLEQLLQTEEILAQEYCPPPSRVFHYNNEDHELKFDLRFYAYKNRIQLAVARLYQGQVTNLKARYGGFACVEFI